MFNGFSNELVKMPNSCNTAFLRMEKIIIYTTAQITTLEITQITLFPSHSQTSLDWLWGSPVLLAGRNCSEQGFKGPEEQYFHQIIEVQTKSIHRFWIYIIFFTAIFAMQEKE